ncbi:MAG TPA: FAD-dependent oxidoreductase, partial [Bacillota bacterium]
MANEPVQFSENPAAGETGPVPARDEATATGAATGAVLVVGGGIAGIQASLDLAQAGYLVHLVTRDPSIGGKMAQLDKTFPTNDCSMCLLGPKMTDCLNHPNIVLHTLAEVTGLSGEPGRFQAEVRSLPRYVDLAACTGCSDCEAACPVELSDAFNQGLSKRKAIYRLFPQSSPNKYAIDKRGRSPCRMACPSGINTQGFISLIARGKYREAWELIRQEMPFPIICGTACHHPCEGVCQRGEVDDPIAISRLKRFVGDHVLGHLTEFYPEGVPVPPRLHPEQVAVVGSGPAGLAAAYHLRRRGYGVTIFEALGVAGGMMRVGIPEYRLPKRLVEAEIDQILKTGIELRTGVAIGRDLDVDDLFAQGFGAVLLAVGAHAPQKIGVYGEDLGGVFHGVTFLRQVNLGQRVAIGARVVVIGGGNTAIDAARTAVRLGAEEVTVAYRRSEAEMTALSEEVEEAREEGVRFEFLTSPIRIIGSAEERVEGIECLRNALGETGTDGRRRPVPIPRSEFIIPAESVIIAVSQAPDHTFLHDTTLETTRGGTIIADQLTLATKLPGVFAAGDAVSGPATLVEAAAAGKEAAESIHRYLQGQDLRAWRTRRPRPEDARRLEISVLGTQRQKREALPRLGAAERRRSFAEVVGGYTAERASAEAQRCLACGGCSECRQCEAVCKPVAIRHDQTGSTTSLEVGAVILAPGFSLTDPRTLGEYGYGLYPNVITGLEFERLLNATGPTRGELRRPGDGGHPRRIAFIQCVGSRDPGRGNPYCSSICCMSSTKEATIAKEHSPDCESTVFYLDLRAQGKGFDRYVQSAKDDYGVRYLRAFVSGLKEDPKTGDLTIRYAADGQIKEERFDLVVLATGLKPPAGARQLADTFGIDLDRHGFADWDKTFPARANKGGIFVAGGFTGPHDIPETVMGAGAAAAEANSLLALARGTLTRPRTYPPEQEVSGKTPRIGVFVCRCGINIASVVDVPTVVARAAKAPGVIHAEEFLFTCSQDSLKKIRETIAEKDLNRVVIASCTIRTHLPLFRDTLREAGLNQYLCEMTNIREQCSWVHRTDPVAATAKAVDLVKMAVAKAATLEPLTTFPVPVVKRALVVGGGLAGLQASLSLAGMGFGVTLLERSAALGGNLTNLAWTLDIPDVPAYLDELLMQVDRQPGITVLTNATVKDFHGHAGHFTTRVEVATGDGPGGGGRTTTDIEHGVVVVATGGRELVPDEYLYGEDSRVLTRLEFERRLKRSGEPMVPVRRAVFIQCVGSRQAGRLYCSRTCCGAAIKDALLLKEADPACETYVLYRDVRAYGLAEEYYRLARERGVVFIRYEETAKPVVRATPSQLDVTVDDADSGRAMTLGADLVVLGAATLPSEGTAEAARAFKLPMTEDGFLAELHAKLGPVDFPSQGLFLCGLAHSPKSIPETILQAQAAASR